MSILEAVMGQGWRSLTLLVLRWCLTQLLSECFWRERMTCLPLSSHLWKQSIMENSMNSSWMALRDSCKQSHSPNDSFFSFKIHSEDSILWVTGPSEGNKPMKGSCYSESQGKASCACWIVNVCTWCQGLWSTGTTLSNMDLRTKLWTRGS